MDIRGDTIVVGAFARDAFRGVAYVFNGSGANWKRTATLEAKSRRADDYFGGRVAISNSGTLIAVARVGDDSGGSGVLEQIDETAKSLTDSGEVMLFSRDGDKWTAFSHIKAAHPGTGENFGSALAFDDDSFVTGANGDKSDAVDVNGDETRDGALGSGAVYVFR